MFINTALKQRGFGCNEGMSPSLSRPEVRDEEPCVGCPALEAPQPVLQPSDCSKNEIIVLEDRAEAISTRNMPSLTT